VLFLTLLLLFFCLSQLTFNRGSAFQNRCLYLLSQIDNLRMHIVVKMQPWRGIHHQDIQFLIDKFLVVVDRGAIEMKIVQLLVELAELLHLQLDLD
jgi:hypothetical protein